MKFFLLKIIILPQLIVVVINSSPIH